MKINKKIILIVYLTSFILFFLAIFCFDPRPKLNKFALKNESKHKLLIPKSYFDETLNKKIRRKLNVGNSYMVFIDKKIYFQLTPLSFRNNNKFDLSYYSEYLPKIFISAEEIIAINESNFAIERSESGNKYQTCLFNTKSPVFFYRFNTYEVVHRYNDYSYWLSIFKRELPRLFRDVRKENFNCLLITANSKEIFDKDSIKMYQIINKNFTFK